jgi:putative peptidoglycan lipid II flippase
MTRSAPTPAGSDEAMRTWTLAVGGRRAWHHSRTRLGALSAREYGIGEAAIILMVSFCLSALLGSVQQALMNAEFGTGPQASAFYAALRLRDLFYSILASRALSGAMIPVLVSSASSSRAAQWRLTNLVLTSLLLLVGAIVCACELLAPVLVATVVAPGFDEPTRELCVAITRIVLLQPLILTIASVATAYLNSRHQFLLVSLSLACHNLGLIAGIVATRLHPQLGIWGPACGVLLGAALQVLVLLPEVRASGLRFRFAWQPNEVALGQVRKLLVPIAASAGLGYFGLVLDTAFASVAREAGAVAAVYNAWLLVSLPMSMLGKAVGQSVFPRLAERAAAHDWMRLRRTCLLSVAAAIGLSVPAVALLVLFGRQLIHVLFEHGQFTDESGSLTYLVLVIYALGVPAAVGLEVVIRGLLALRNTRAPLLAELGQVIARGMVMLFLVSRLGVIAIPTAFAAVSAVELAAIGLVLRFELRRPRLQVRSG